MIRHTLASSIVALSLATGVAFAANKGGEAPATPPAPPAAPKAEKVEVITLGIRNDIPMPTSKAGGRSSKYDFDKLEVGQSFGVIGKTAKSFNSIIYAAEQRLGDKVLNADGSQKKRIKKLKAGGTELVDEVKVTRTFEAHDVDPNADPDKATVRVFRRT